METPETPPKAISKGKKSKSKSKKKAKAPAPTNQPINQSDDIVIGSSAMPGNLNLDEIVARAKTVLGNQGNNQNVPQNAPAVAHTAPAPAFDFTRVAKEAFTKKTLGNRGGERALKPVSKTLTDLTEEPPTETIMACHKMLTTTRLVTQTDVRNKLFNTKGLLTREQYSVTFEDHGRQGANTNFKVAVQHHDTKKTWRLPLGEQTFIRLFHIPAKKNK